MMNVESTSFSPLNLRHSGLEKDLIRSKCSFSSSDVMVKYDKSCFSGQNINLVL